MQANEIQALVERKATLDQAARAIEIFDYLTEDGLRVERYIIQYMKHNLNQAQHIFEEEVAALSQEHRWQFMFKCMLTGVFDDEFEFKM